MSAFCVPAAAPHAPATGGTLINTLDLQFLCKPTGKIYMLHKCIIHFFVCHLFQMLYLGVQRSMVLGWTIFSNFRN